MKFWFSLLAQIKMLYRQMIYKTCSSSLSGRLLIHIPMPKHYPLQKHTICIFELEIWNLEIETL